MPSRYRRRRVWSGTHLLFDYLRYITCLRGPEYHNETCTYHTARRQDDIRLGNWSELCTLAPESVRDGLQGAAIASVVRPLVTPLLATRLAISCCVVASGGDIQALANCPLLDIPDGSTKRGSLFFPYGPFPGLRHSSGKPLFPSHPRSRGHGFLSFLRK